MNLFYAPEITRAPFLPKEESLHCVRVLRKGVGDTVQIIDGRGTLYDAIITVSSPQQTEVHITAVHEHFAERPYQLHIAIAPTKNMERMEWFVEKAVEIGIDYITPIVSRYSERMYLKTERLQKIAVAAAKQSLKADLPQIAPITPFAEFVMTHRAGFIAHCHNSEREPLWKLCPQHAPVTVLIGPEGDFSDDEVALSIQCGYRSVSLGQSRLRTETAGIVACHTVALKNT